MGTILVWASLLGSACSTDVAPPAPITALPHIDESALPPPHDEAGFVQLDAVTYTAPQESEREIASLPTRLFYRFVAAESDAGEKPLFVFFNGGPGFTSMLLLSYGTGPYTLDLTTPDAPPKPNAHSFAQLGNLLFIDARDAGFSYQLSEHPEDAGERFFKGGSPSAAHDAADFVRVVLTVMERQPRIRNNPVVLVGESYGGERATLMLHLLLEPRDEQATSDVYVEPTLAAQIDEHYTRVFPGNDPRKLDPRVRALQFGWQVLIEPLVIQGVQSTLPASPDQHPPDPDGPMVAAMRSIDSFRLLIGVDPLSVEGLPAAKRGGAYRVVGNLPVDPDSAEFVAELGELPEWDRYFKPVGDARFDSHTIRYTSEFLRNVRYVETLITNARLDDNLDSQAVLPAIREVVAMQPTPWLEAARYLGDDPDTVSERIELDYAELAGFWPAARRTIYFPRYEESGHTVTAFQAEKFFTDVRGFLTETQALTP